MSNYTEADVERWWTRLAPRTEGSLEAQWLLNLKTAALEGAKVPGLVATLENFRKHLGPNQQGVGWEQDVFSAIDTERELLADIERVAPDWSPLNGPHEIVGHLAGKLEEAQSEVSALQARVAEAERREAVLRADADAMLLKLESIVPERDALRAQVEALDAALDEAIQEVDGYDVAAAVALRRAQEAALSAPPAEATPALMDDGHIQACGNGGEDWRNCSPECRKAQKATEATPAPERAEAAPLGETATCPHCQKTVTTRVPTGGDGSLRLLRRHLCATGWRSDVESE